MKRSAVREVLQALTSAMSLEVKSKKSYSSYYYRFKIVFLKGMEGKVPFLSFFWVFTQESGCFDPH